MGICNSSNGPKQGAPIEEKKAVIDPSLVLPAPEFKRCGADDLHIQPIELNPQPVAINNNNILNNNIPNTNNAFNNNNVVNTNNVLNTNNVAFNNNINNGFNNINLNNNPTNN